MVMGSHLLNQALAAAVGAGVEAQTISIGVDFVLGWVASIWYSYVILINLVCDFVLDMIWN